ncbi:hypothetical protein [Brevibacillus borstelensis]|uniref:hypothetical protein n=1 Tax=Brevibacillus borstelensis TaxID=45462 RepID=UPI00046A1088|nr:hypothetical protein [Brevibacillus borstelensis]
MRIYDEYKRIRYYFYDPILFPDEKNDKATGLLEYLEFYVNMSTIQMQRLHADDQDIDRAYNETGSNSKDTLVAFTKYFGDIHFCLICLDKVYKLAYELAEYLQDPVLISIVQNYSKLDNYRRARNALEHMEEKIIKTNWFRSEFGRVSNDTLTLNKTEFKIDISTLEPVYSLYDEFIKRFNELIEPRKPEIDKVWSAFKIGMGLSEDSALE